MFRCKNALLLLLFIFILAIALATSRKDRTKKHLKLLQRKMTAPVRRMRCPYRCKCNSLTKEVNCAFRKLTKVPRNIPVSTRTLNLTGNQIKVLSARHFYMLRHLEVLELSGNHVEQISNRLFRQTRKLIRLNLSSNKLESLPRRAFTKLSKLKVLSLRNNKLGKLPVDAFDGLIQVVEIDLSANFLQTLELKIFQRLSNLKDLFLDNNRWHCDCLLKKVEVDLRERQIRTGYIVCDSPNTIAGQHLREHIASNLCGTKADELVYILLAATCGVFTILFVVFMCRKRIPTNLDVSETTTPESDAATLGKREDSFSRSSILSDSDMELNKSLLQKHEKKNLDLLKASCELNLDVLPLTSHFVDNNAFQPQQDISLVTSSKVASRVTSVSSCPDFSNLSSMLDTFADKR